MTPLSTVSLSDVRKKIQAGDYQEGLDILSRLPDPSVVDSAVESLRGQALEGMGRLSEAEAAYWKALSSEVNRSPHPYLCLGLLKDRMGDRERSLWVLEEGLRHFPQDIDLRREAGILYGLTGQWHRALPLILEAYRDAPDRSENIMAFGPAVDRMELVELYGEMHRAFSRLLDRSPNSPDVQDWYGRSLERIEKSGQAQKFFRGILRKSPRDKRLLAHVARISRNTNETARALDTYRLLMEETGETPDLLLAMAETHKMAGKPLAALPLIRQALALDPENPEARLLLGLVAVDQGDAEKAQNALAGIDSATAHYQLGELFLRKKEPRRAVGALARGFALRPDPYHAPELLDILLEEGEDLLFLETLAFLRILFPRTKVSSGLLRRAEAHFSGALSGKEGDDPESLAIAGLAEAFLPGHDRDRAFRLLEQAVTVDPLSEALYWTLAMIDEDAGRWMSAIAWYEKVKKNSREPVTLLFRIAENRHNAHLSLDPWPLLEDFSNLYGPMPGFFRALSSIAVRSDIELAREILIRGMAAFPDDPSLFSAYRSLDPDRWNRLLAL
jgi:tetratricopeptide (TPR) repeat protein